MMTPPSKQDIQEQVRIALNEDIGSGDLTANLIPEDHQSIANVLCREDAVLCGAEWFDEVYRQLDPTIHISWYAEDGESVHKNQTICTLKGNARNLLTGERTALNFLQTLSGTASIAHQYAEAVNGTGTEVLDTRKTIPGFRTAQKYAVHCGGCRNHRMGLYDAILIKENHIMAAGSIHEAVQKAQHANVTVEVEVETLKEVHEALAAGADILLLDNMDLETLREAVRINEGRAKLEASGGITLENIRSIAETGVDYISVGALTKDVRATDFSMRFRQEPDQVLSSLNR